MEASFRAFNFLVSLSLNWSMWTKVPSQKLLWYAPPLLLHSVCVCGQGGQGVFILDYCCIIVLASQAYLVSPTYTMRRWQESECLRRVRGWHLPRLNQIAMALSPQGQLGPRLTLMSWVWIRVMGVHRASQVILIYNLFFYPYLFPESLSKKLMTWYDYLFFGP